MTFLSNDAIDRLREVATRPELPAGRYELIRPLGRGGMGAVYEARDVLLGREVAIKVSNAITTASPLDERLRQEALVLASLEHPGIVPVHDAGVLDDGRAFYVMKLVQGETLEQHLTRLTSEAARLGVLERIVETMAFAHAARVVHRDLKPSNIMVGRFGEVLVLDWGVATRLDDRAAGGGLRVGTAGFMAPELGRGDAAIAGPPADVFSLGAIANWMIGQTRVPRRLRAIVSKSLSPDRAERYQDAAALLADLQRYRAGETVSAHRETPLERAGLWALRYRTFILLVAAYLLMRTLFALW